MKLTYTTLWVVSRSHHPEQWAHKPETVEVSSAGACLTNAGGAELWGEIVTLAPGEIVFFDGLLLHCGTAGEGSGVGRRIFAYLSSVADKPLTGDRAVGIRFK